VRISFGSLSVLVWVVLLGSGAWANDVKIDTELEHFVMDVMGAPVKIERNPDTMHRLNNSYTKTSRPCPPFCIQPFESVKGVETIGELELVRFMQQEVSQNSGVLVDARMPKWYRQGTIPGSVNIPFSIFSKSHGDQYTNKLFPLLGAQKATGAWDFSQAQTLAIFDNGPWCQQANLAIKNLLKLGYPTAKILYYRGGMQYWQILGFTTLKPQE
jgi:rhodanese-related sulfurtransferase